MASIGRTSKVSAALLVVAGCRRSGAFGGTVLVLCSLATSARAQQPAEPPAQASPAPAAAAPPAPAKPVSPAQAPPAPGPEPAPPPVTWADPPDAQAYAALPAPAPEATGIEEPPLPPPYEPPEVDRLSIVALFYNTAAAVGETRDFVGGFSWTGFSFDFRQRVHQKIAAGLSLAWQSFSYKSQRTSTLGAVTVTGTQARYQSVFPLLVTGYFFPSHSAEGVLPYLGLGAGGYRVERVLDVGPSARFSDSSWHFGFAPELGISFPSQSGSLLIATKFHYAFKADGAPQQMYFNFNLGGGFD